MVRRCSAISADEVANDDDQFKESIANWRRGRDDCHDPARLILISAACG